MLKQKKLVYMVLGGIIALTLVFGGAATFAQTDDDADDSPPAPGDALSEGESPFGRGRENRDGFGRGDFGKRGGLDVNHDELLADALGITTAELQEAHEAAKTAAVEQALTQGLLTEEQAAAILENDRGFRGFGRFGRGLAADSIDFEALLADALGISTEDLQTARETAKEAGIQQALDEGIITQKQVDLMNAAQALKDYIDKDALMAEALGISVAELTAAKEDGTLRELIAGLDIDRQAVGEALQAAHEEAVQQAVTDDVITQEQADQLQSRQGRGFGGHRGGHHGRGGLRGAPNGAPAQEAPTTTSTSV
jgi:hypothetical protein